MAARLFQRLGSSSNMVKLFEIRPDNDIIILRGSGEEAASQWLTGVVVLSLSAPMEVKDVRLEFTGNKKISWHDSNAHLLHPRAERESVIYKHDWEPFVKGGTLPADNYEWPFRVQLPGTTAESVEGIPEKYILYKLKAAVNRGRMSHDLHVWKPIRIVRTLGPDALELSHAMTVENIWTNKIEYEIVIPQKGVVFGTSITIKMQFTTLLKGLRIGTITAQLVEFQEFAVDKIYKATREVATWTFELTNENYHDMLSENGQDGYRLEGDCPLPKDLRKCLQDVDVQGIKIRHKVKFKVSLHNPDGHVSELRATLPVTIFISPNMPLNPDGCLVDQTPRSAQAVENVQHAPPLYGEHVLDQLYADVDTSGIMTPLPQSGMNTPFYAGSQSRSGSQENLHSFALSNGAQLSQSPPANGAVTPAALSSRLQNLHVGSLNNSFNATRAGSGSSTPHHEGDTGHSGQNGHSSRNSSRNSEEDHHHHEGARMTPVELDDLSRVPSYRTAVMTPVRGMSQSDVVPTYSTATSRPATPIRANSSASTSRGHSLRTNGTAHVSEAMSNIGFTPVQPPNPAASPQSDAERNLFLLRQRE